MNVENLLEAVSKEINILKTARERYAKQLAPGFSVFNYIYTDEMMLSRIIADLLNPKGKHAQGSIFLKLFFEQFGLGQVWQDKELERAQKIQVEPEVLTDLIERKQRRIDILIKFENPEYFLCIENKPFAADQYKQLEDYAMQLHLSCNQNQQNWHLIYLSGTGNEPAEYSVDKIMLESWRNNQQFTQINYPDLVDWLKQCIAQCQNQKVVNFLNEFQAYILNVFAGVKDMSEQDKILSEVLENKNFDTAIKILAMRETIRQELLNKLKLQIREKILNSDKLRKDWRLEGELTLTAYSKLDIFFSHNQQKCFSIQFGSGECQKIMVGIRNFKENKNFVNDILGNQIHAILSSTFSSNYHIKRSDAWWPFYFFLEDISNGKTDTELWQQIQSGTLCERIMDYAEKTYKALEYAKLLDQL